MSLLYLNEHLSCLNYEKGSRPVIEVSSIGKGNLWKIDTRETKIIFITEGIIKISFGEIIDKIVSEGKIILIPPGSKLKIEAEKSASITIFRLRLHARLCERYSLEQLLQDEDINTVEKQGFLDINQMLWGFYGC